MQNQKLEQFEVKCAAIARKRLWVFSAGVVSIVLLPLLLALLNQLQHEHRQLEKTLASMSASLEQIPDVEQLFAQFSQQNTELQNLAQEVEQRGLVPRDWTVRRISLNRVETTRAEAEIYLDSIAQSPTVYFIPDKFEAKVADSKDDLFRWRIGGKDSVYISIFGQYYSRKPQ